MDDSHEDRLEDLEEVDTHQQMKMELLHKRDQTHKRKIGKLIGRKEKVKKKDDRQDKQIGRLGEIYLKNRIRNF